MEYVVVIQCQMHVTIVMDQDVVMKMELLLLVEKFHWQQMMSQACVIVMEIIMIVMEFVEEQLYLMSAVYVMGRVQMSIMIVLVIVYQIRMVI